jgi:hypothetical protein
MISSIDLRRELNLNRGYLHAILVRAGVLTVKVPTHTNGGIQGLIWIPDAYADYLRQKLRNGKVKFRGRNWTGQWVGYLEILRPVGRNKRQLILWECRCHYQNCTNIVIYSSEVFRKDTISCGCFARKQTRRRALAKYQETGNE